MDDPKNKSDKSPEELMSQVSEPDGDLDPSKKVSAVDAMAEESNAEGEDAKSKPKEKGLKALLSKVNIYLILFIFVIVLACAVYAVLYFMNKREQDIKLETATITEQTLENLKTADAVVGDPQQILNIESHTVINGKVIMKDTLDVAGALKVGGTLSIPSLGVAGEASFGSLQTNDFSAGGNAAIGGILDAVGDITGGGRLSVSGDITGGGNLSASGNGTLGGNLDVSGAANIGGRLDVGGQATIGGNLQVNGTVSAQGINFDTISITRINITGNRPGINVGSAAGGGGTASISGTDTAGTITVNTGGGTHSGVLATINFTGSFNSSNPHVVATPNSAACANIGYYITNVSANNFSLATSTTPPTGSTCKFNYIVIN